MNTTAARPKVAEFYSNYATDIRTLDPTVTLPSALKPSLRLQVFLQNRSKHHNPFSCHPVIMIDN